MPHAWLRLPTVHPEMNIPPDLAAVHMSPHDQTAWHSTGSRYCTTCQQHHTWPHDPHPEAAAAWLAGHEEMTE